MKQKAYGAAAILLASLALTLHFRPAVTPPEESPSFSGMFLTQSSDTVSWTEWTQVGDKVTCQWNKLGLDPAKQLREQHLTFRGTVRLHRAEMGTDSFQMRGVTISADAEREQAQVRMTLRANGHPLYTGLYQPADKQTILSTSNAFRQEYGRVQAIQEEKEEPLMSPQPIPQQEEAADDPRALVDTYREYASMLKGFPDKALLVPTEMRAITEQLKKGLARLQSKTEIMLTSGRRNEMERMSVQFQLGQVRAREIGEIGQAYTRDILPFIAKLRQLQTSCGTDTVPSCSQLDKMEKTLRRLIGPVPKALKEAQVVLDKEFAEQQQVLAEASKAQ